MLGDLPADRLTERLVGLEGVEGQREVLRAAALGVGGLQGVPGLRRRRGITGFDPQAGGSHQSRRRQVQVGGAVGEPVFEAAGSAPPRGHPYGHRAVVVAPVGPVARKLAGLQALVGVDRRGAQCGQRLVVGEHAGDGVPRHVRQAVAGVGVVEQVPTVVAGDAEVEVGAVAAPVLERPPQEGQQQAVAQRHLAAELLQQKGAVQRLEGVPVADHHLELRIVVLAARRLDADPAGLGGRQDVVEQPHRVHNRARAVAIRPRRVPGLPVSRAVGLQDVSLQLHANLGGAAGGRCQSIDGALGGQPARNRQGPAQPLEVGDDHAGAVVPAGAHCVQRIARREVAHALQHLGAGRGDEVAVVADAEDRHREPHLAGHGGGGDVLAPGKAELVGEQDPDSVHSIWEHRAISPSGRGFGAAPCRFVPGAHRRRAGRDRGRRSASRPIRHARRWRIVASQRGHIGSGHGERYRRCHRTVERHIGVLAVPRVNGGLCLTHRYGGRRP